MTGQHDLDPIGWEKLLDATYDFRDDRVAVLFTPTRPAFHSGLEIRYNHGAIRDEFAQKTGLRPNMLDVAMPVVTGL